MEIFRVNLLMGCVWVGSACSQGYIWKLCVCVLAVCVGF